MKIELDQMVENNATRVTVGSMSKKLWINCVVSSEVPVAKCSADHLGIDVVKVVITDSAPGPIVKEFHSALGRGRTIHEANALYWSCKELTH